jgi:SAM-dependent methyltransferase
VLAAGELEERAVAVADPAMLDTRRAFDAVAVEYHRSNAGNPILREMRRRTLDAVRRHVAPGGRLLDLGCGPGTDAQTLIDAGYAVTAIDWSAAMVEQARHRVQRSAAPRRGEVHQLGIDEIARLDAEPFDGALSNFGPLNCVADLHAAAGAIAAKLRPGAVLVASVIGRWCPWEVALFTVKRDWRRIAIRFSTAAVPVPLNGNTIWTRYYSPREVERAFGAAGLGRVSVRGLGLLAPPPYMEGLARRHPDLVAALHRVDDRIGGWPGLRHFGDHFLIVLRKP